MRRILKLLVRLYPAEWLERYRAEYDALLEERESRASDAIDVLWGATKMRMTSWSFVSVVLPSALVGMLIALAAFFAVPPRYLSQMVFPVITTDTTASSLMSEGAPNAFSQEFLGSIIQKRNLYPRERSRMPLDNVVGKMRSNIHFRATPEVAWRGFEGLSFLPIKPGRLEPVNIAVQFDYPDPNVAQSVDAELARWLLFGAHGPAWSGGPPYPFSISKNGINAYIRSGATFSRKPDGLGPIQFGSIGLVAGLLCGFGLASILERFLKPRFANG